MYLILFITLTIVFGSSCQNESSNCVLPDNLLNECAEVIPENSTNQMIERYPWHVALYRLKSNMENVVPINVCGGTLLSASVMITAAHCLAEDVNGSLRDISEYFVAAGNEFREINDERDAVERQIRKIKKVVLPTVYRGHQSGFKGDIAIVELQNPLVFSHVVRPACLSRTPSLFEGETVGWGLTVASRDPNSRLSHLIVPYVDFATCRREVDIQFHQYLTDDKFCGVFSKGSSICSTDNGGGILHTEKHANGKVHWYLEGITSVGLISGGSCVTKQYSAFTSLQNYLPLICQSIVSNL